ncbi:MAG: type 4a pilus biogenesis protein PilO [Candidatus Omnitrophica bacterium]|nr:type 4a pilus biogenesis protein PilO [Candidatus Omnitrophota bacterium]
MSKLDLEKIKKAVFEKIRSKVGLLLEKMHLDKDKKETVFILGGLFVIVCLLYFFLLIFSPFVQSVHLFNETCVMKKEIETLESDIERLNVLNSRIESMKETVELYEEKLPSEYEIPLFLEELSGKAKDTYVKITGISPITIVQKVSEKEKKEGRSYEKIPIQINAESGYHQLGLFLNKMETGDRFVDISSIMIYNSERTPKIENIELTLNAYVLLEKQ